MNCEDLATRLTDFLEGTLNSAEEEQALEHVAACPACELVLSGTRDVIDLVHDHGYFSMPSKAQEQLLGSILDQVTR